MFWSRFSPKIKFQPLIAKILENCKPDWVEFRTEIVLKEVDEDVETIRALWEAEDRERNKPIFLEEKPDGSEAQKLLGGPMRIKSSWWEGKHESFNKPPKQP
jgi:hypothetical protein